MLCLFLSCLVRFFDLKKQKRVGIQYGCCDYNYSNFLKNGNLVTFTFNNSISKYPIIIIYSLSNKNEWKYKTVYEFNIKNIKFGGVINDKMWMITNDLIHLLDLSTFQFQKLSLYVSIFFIIV